MSTRARSPAAPSTGQPAPRRAARPAAPPAKPAVAAPRKAAQRGAAETPATGDTVPRAGKAPKADTLTKVSKPSKVPKAPKLPKAPKPAKPAKVEKAPKADAKPPKVRPRLVRDGFTMPEADFSLIGTLKARALAGAHPAKKSELLRAGLHALAALDTPSLVAALSRLEPVKTGRPGKGG